MHPRHLVLAIDAHEPARVAAFWAGLLGRTAVDDARGVLVPGSDTQVGLRFTRATTDKVGPNRVHLHVTSNGARGQQATVEAAVALGASPLDVGQLPQERHVVLADPEGNELCVIEPENAFLAGTGLLGELACDGTRGVGHFWAEALGWPLVWDQDEETAIQSPAGGTKVAWGGPPVQPRRGRNRQRFELTVSDVGVEVDGLLRLGATAPHDLADGVRAGRAELADPDGNEFCVAGG